MADQARCSADYSRLSRFDLSRNTPHYGTFPDLGADGFGALVDQEHSAHVGVDDKPRQSSHHLEKWNSRVKMQG